MHMPRVVRAEPYYDTATDAEQCNLRWQQPQDIMIEKLFLPGRPTGSGTACA